MYRLSVLFGLAFIACQAADVDLKKCMMLFHPNSAACCKKNANALKKMDENVKECMKIPKPPGGPPSCEWDMCIAEKKGFLASDGTLNKDALKRSLEKDFAGEQELLSIVIEKCVNGDINKFAPPDFCEFAKLRHCILYQVYMTCPEWEQTDQCTKVKELSEQCKF